MTPQIKQRIEQIRRGEVPEGYKKTKVGIVPADWQEHKLSHYLTVNNDKNTDLKYTKDDVFSISGELGIVNQIELLGRSYAGVSVAPYGIVYPNDVVYTKSPLKANPYGIIKTNKLGVTGIVSTLYAIFHCNNNVSPDYVQLYFESDHKLNNYLYPIVNIGAKHDMKISDEGSLRGTVVFPPLPEQEKIAAILQTEDKVIELQQKKIDELKRLKKVYLSKMFPKKCCNVPEIRFPEFTDHWEQRKVSELFRVTRGYVLAATQTETTKTDEKPYPVYSSQTKDKGLMGYYKDYLYEDAITWTTDGANAGTVNYRAGKFYCTNVCGVLLSNEVKANQMIAEALNSVAKGYVSYVGNPKLMNNVMADIVIQIPTQAEEREQLSSFFSKLDNLITLHQRKCDEEKQKKKALMQLLLTGIVRT